MTQFLSTLPRNVIGSFRGWNILYHLGAIVLTLILVTSGFDWVYFRSTRSPELRAWMFPAVIIGQALPLMLPLVLLLIGIVLENAKAIRVAWAIGQAAFIGWFIASCYKALTGRDHPPHGIGIDTSRIFRFGFLRHGKPLRSPWPSLCWCYSRENGGSAPQPSFMLSTLASASRRPSIGFRTSWPAPSLEQRSEPRQEKVFRFP